MPSKSQMMLKRMSEAAERRSLPFEPKSRKVAEPKSKSQPIRKTAQPNKVAQPSQSQRLPNLAFRKR